MRVKYNKRDYTQRLDNGVVFYGDEPMLLRVHDNFFRLYHLATIGYSDEHIDVSFDDPLINIQAPKLGFVNNKNLSAEYLMRMPVRAYKQSLCLRNLIGFSPLTNREDNCKSKFKDIYYTLKNQYPTVDVTLHNLKTDQCVAVSRDIALHKDSLGIIKVWYKTLPVGFMSPLSTTVELVDKKDIYFKQLSKIGVPIR